MSETQSTSNKQSAKEDISRIADTAKKAAEGFDFNRLFIGRIDQMNYMYGALSAIVIGMLLMYIPVVGMILAIILSLVGLGMTARRLHNIGVTGWAALVLFVPIAGLLAVVYLCWKRGEISSNQYGAAPDPKREIFHAWLNT